MPKVHALLSALLVTLTSVTAQPAIAGNVYLKERESLTDKECMAGFALLGDNGYFIPKANKDPNDETLRFSVGLLSGQYIYTVVETTNGFKCLYRQKLIRKK